MKKRDICMTDQMWAELEAIKEALGCSGKAQVVRMAVKQLLDKLKTNE